MNFTTLRLDKDLILTNVFGSCGKCENKETSAICQVCKNTDFYVKKALVNPSPSFVMLSTPLYEQLVRAEVVNYYVVVAIYMATLDVISIYLNPDSTIPFSDKKWMAEARPFRTPAYALWTKGQEQTTKEVFEAKDALTFLRGLESRLCFGLVLLEQCSVRTKIPLEERVLEEHKKKLEFDLSRELVECTWDRCGRDKVGQKREMNTRWNERYHITNKLL